MKVLKEEINIREGKDRTFIVSLVREDEITAEEFNTNFKQMEESFKELNKRLKTLDSEKEKAKEFMKESIKNLEPKYNKFKEFDTKARIWADLNKKENERKQGIKPSDKQEDKTNKSNGE
jgi:galactokinase